MNNSAAYFGIIPAAGKSLRMGSEHKLLMPWGRGRVIDQVLSEWSRSRVRRVFVTVRKDDVELQQACAAWDVAEVVLPKCDPIDMKQSVQIALGHVDDRYSPGSSDFWLMAPADLPTLRASHIDRLIDASSRVRSIVVPRFGTRRGHPVLFPWALVPEVFSLRSDLGINQLIEHHAVTWVDFPAGERPEDIDTPADYERVHGKWH